MWLSRLEITNAVWNVYKEVIWSEPDLENQRSLEYITNAVIMNQFWNNNDQIIFNTFGFNPDQNKKLAEWISNAIRALVSLNNKRKKVVVQTLEWWCKVNYSDSVGENLNTWVFYSKVIELEWSKFTIEVWRDKVPWESLVTEYLWVRFPSWGLSAVYGSITNETFLAYVNQLVANIWSNSPSRMDPTDLFKDIHIF